jgi:hypothetical protein
MMNYAATATSYMQEALGQTGVRQYHHRGLGFYTDAASGAMELRIELAGRRTLEYRTLWSTDSKAVAIRFHQAMMERPQAFANWLQHREIELQLAASDVLSPYDHRVN